MELAAYFWFREQLGTKKHLFQRHPKNSHSHSKKYFNNSGALLSLHTELKQNEASSFESMFGVWLLTEEGREGGGGERKEGGGSFYNDGVHF